MRPPPSWRNRVSSGDESGAHTRPAQLMHTHTPPLLGHATCALPPHTCDSLTVKCVRTLARARHTARRLVGYMVLHEQRQAARDDSIQAAACAADGCGRARGGRGDSAVRDPKRSAVLLGRQDVQREDTLTPLQSTQQPAGGGGSWRQRPGSSIQWNVKIS